MSVHKGNKAQYKIETIFFDVGGVILVDFIEQKIIDLAEKYQKDPAELLKSKAKHRPLADSGKISDPQFWVRVLEDNGIEAVENDWALDSYMQSINGTFDIIDSLKRNGYRIVILSNDSKEMSGQRRQKYLFDSLFDDVIISSEHGVIKPASEIYKIALKRTQTIPENSIFIDDRQENLDTAAEIGIHTILFEDSEQLKEQMCNLGICLD